MTNNVWEETLSTPWEIDPVGSGLIGGALRYEWPVSQRWSVGLEGQVVGHFGRQDHVAVNLPALINFEPQSRWSGPLQRVGFGIGLSFASKPPQVEIDRSGESQETLVFWMADLGVQGPFEDSEVFLRLHHRSDGFGLFEADAGSNAIVLGLRKGF